MDSSGYNRKCAANWGVPVRDRAEIGGLLAGKRNRSKFRVRANRPFLCQKGRWANKVDELGQA